jgi:hypothetical protein
MYCICVESYGMISPPALYMAAVDPLAVHVRKPELRTCKNRDDNSPSSSRPVPNRTLYRLTLAGDGCATSTSFSANSSISRPLIIVRILANRVGSVSPRNAASNTRSASNRFAAHKCPVDRRSSNGAFVMYILVNSSFVAGSVLIPNTGTSTSRARCAEINVVPSPPNAMITSCPRIDSSRSA